MITSRTKYRVVVSHPTDYYKGEHLLTVSRWSNGTCFVDGEAFGCSRDYNIPKDVDAIRMFLSEHTCKVVSAKITH